MTMESELVIKEKSSFVDKHLLALVKRTVLASRDLGAKPNFVFVGADVPYYANEYQRFAYRLILSGQIQVGMMKWSRKYGPNTMFTEDIITSAPQIFVADTYNGEWLDRAKIFYTEQVQRFGRELKSISELYNGIMSDISLTNRATGSDQDQILGDEPSIDDVVKFIAKSIDDGFRNPVAGLEFIHWLGSTIPIITTVDHNSAQYIFRSNQFLQPDEINLISQFGELCDASIQANPSLPSFSRIQIPLLNQEEKNQLLVEDDKGNLTIKHEYPNWDVKLISEERDDTDLVSFVVDGQDFTTIVNDYVEETFSNLSRFAKQVVVNEQVYKRQIQLLKTEEKQNANEIKKSGRFLKYHTQSNIIGNSTFYIFIYSLEDVHPVVTRKETSEIIRADRPNKEFREALVFKHFSDTAEAMLNKKILLELENGIRSIVPKTSGLTSIQVQKAIEKSIKEEIYRAQVEADKDEDLKVVVSLKEFERQRKDLISNISGVKIPDDDELIPFEKVAGHDFVKYLLQTFVIQFLDDPKWRKVLPQGIILTGPPGTGKSYIAYAIAYYAKKCGWTFIDYDPSVDKKGIVGESEKASREKFEFFDSFDNLIIWVDEGDVAFGSGRGQGGDSGVSQNLFAQLLKFFGSGKRIGKVILITATNRIEDIDPALRSRLPLVIYMAALQASGVEQLANLRFDHLHETVDPTIQFEGGQGAIAKEIYRVNPDLAGRILLFSLNTLVAFAKQITKKGEKVLVKKSHVKLLLSNMNVGEGLTGGSKDMDIESKRNATFRTDFRNNMESKTPAKVKKPTKKVKKSKKETKVVDNTLDL